MVANRAGLKLRSLPSALRRRGAEGGGRALAGLRRLRYPLPALLGASVAYMLLYPLLTLLHAVIILAAALTAIPLLIVTGAGA